MQVLQSKKKLLDKLQAEVANSEDAQLKRILSEAWALAPVLLQCEPMYCAFVSAL